MSSLLQKPENTAALADFITKQLNMGHDYTGMWSVPDLLYESLNDLNCSDGYGFFDTKRVYNALVDLNISAWSGRYNEPDDLERVPYKANPIATHAEYIGAKEEHGCRIEGHYKISAWHYKIYKMLQFFNYQCEEDKTWHNPLHKGLVELARSLAEFIAMNSYIYNGLDWE